jgi:hypothetical protein
VTRDFDESVIRELDAAADRLVLLELIAQEGE